VIGALVVLPLGFGPGTVNLMSYALILGILALSLLILTGWAGEISLGQWAFAGFGAAVAGTVAQNGGDFFVAIALAGLAGAVVSIIIGLPALRIRGPFLAVATFGFALASSSFFLNQEFSFFAWYVPDPFQRILRPSLFGRFDLESETTYYYVVLVMLGLVVLSVRSLRRSRTGRVLVASRENERAAQAFGVNLIRVRLTGFALSGFIAALAGGLFALHQHNMIRSQLQPAESIALFSIVVFGGLGSMAGVLLGVAWFSVLTYAVASPTLRLLTTGFGLLLILLVLPGGLGQLVYGARDNLLRRVARRRGLIVPSLLADVREEADDGSGPEEAEAHIPELAVEPADQEESVSVS
jgi:branched-chain amino acid transport system permease protein